MRQEDGSESAGKGCQHCDWSDDKLCCIEQKPAQHGRDKKYD